MTARALQKVLVANRGEIALRIMRTLREQGMRSVAVYASADAGSPHVTYADEAVPLMAAELAGSYLNVERLIEAARRTGAQAIHPGYGLLSENAAFARACSAAGLVFVGPRPETIELMGDKRRARLAVAASGVPCVPGYDGEDQSDATLLREAARVGFPLMVKARAGGGGRGMRRVPDAAQLQGAIERARSEAKQAFGDDGLILERAIERGRHVEVQVFGDMHGRVVHMAERDCSAQRRFQKILEESPSPALTPELRARMGEIAVRAAQAASYVGAGTVEFLLCDDGTFYFLEMNSRLQVEHPVTEAVTGLDLVAWQLDVAQGRALPLSQAELDARRSGHAIEARLYAEDPARDFLPSTGTILALRVPEAAGLRVDHALRAGLTISPYYDPMLAKLIAHAPTREAARAKLLTALAELRVLGVATNQAFLAGVLGCERFAAGTMTTDAIENEVVQALPSVSPSRDTLLAAAVLFATRASRRHGELAGFASAGVEWPMALELTGEVKRVRVQPGAERDAFVVHGAGDAAVVSVVARANAVVTLGIDGIQRAYHHAFSGDALFLHGGDAGPHALRDVTHARERLEERGTGRALAPLDGAVIQVPVKVGERVVRGATLAVVSAMKLELRVCADVDGVVREVHAAVGDQVKARKLLVKVEAEVAAS